MKDHLLIIFTRNPEPGKVKTRLAKTVGESAALDVYTFLLNHTRDITQNLQTDKTVYYSDTIAKDDLWPTDRYAKRLQHGTDLGQRMENAFLTAFEEGYKKVTLIGSDIYELSQKHLEEALEALGSHDAVIGPAEDGGYYLIGLRTMNPELFRNKRWSTDTVLKDTLDDLKGKNIHLLETLNDIDTYEDIKNNPVFDNLIKSHKSGGRKE
ncbi:TIGR04282 family arsenosugar biosynthesis glycosyltransferase [Sinomicrobium weinanense]|uniref:TIGR04282 family arsenosugar biosynthesis glycosyltransferase n=1 Tax=Sinomicrobium weinanense TaxID=2842200 RepID=A0A926Q1Z5_9FLAO|nr:TIGR04282 family arsenosugar biosynthesis glycosyltransferase [Sinomicrobium weinanense]MBC9794381.1 TIGR04282 family arsenosugar biosynthesis glycosyltransferase [Sinomicrobium weinanense]MBU3124288.1 TIGR04282 family arsenosugar biosynthesis glycosyltransferase [Sinomicrobium weinanense]